VTGDSHSSKLWWTGGIEGVVLTGKDATLASNRSVSLLRAFLWGAGGVIGDSKPVRCFFGVEYFVSGVVNKESLSLQKIESFSSIEGCSSNDNPRLALLTGVVINSLKKCFSAIILVELIVFLNISIIFKQITNFI
jgi:hypothetical protein